MICINSMFQVDDQQIFERKKQPKKNPKEYFVYVEDFNDKHIYRYSGISKIQIH